MEPGGKALCFFVHSKVNDDHYMVQRINPVIELQHVLKIVRVTKMLTWRFYDNADFLKQDLLHAKEKGTWLFDFEE